MLIPMTDLQQYGINPTAIVHAGAHESQERFMYRKIGVTDCLWIEANPALIPTLTENVEPYGHRVANACLASTVRECVPFYIAEADNLTNRGQSSSLLPLGLHLTEHPEVSYVDEITVNTRTLDSVVAEYAPEWLERGGMMLNADTQGTELDILKGAPETLAACDSVYCEVNIAEMYEGCGLLPELDAFLVAAGFECVRVKLAGAQRRDLSDNTHHKFHSWGDGIWVRRENPRPFSQTHPEDYADWIREPLKFLIICVGRQCEDKVYACLESIAMQRGQQFHVVIVDDASTDGTWEAVQAFVENDPLPLDATAWQTPERRGAMRNQWEAWHVDVDWDVCLWVDMDDKLAHPDVLNRLAREYEAGALMTYGSYRSEPYSPTCAPATPYPKEVLVKRAFRQWIREARGICHNHARSVSAEVLLQITEEDCKDSEGNWWMTGPDMAVFLPAMEIAGTKIAFIKDCLYAYSSDRGESEWRAVPELVRSNHAEMLARPPKVKVQLLALPHIPVRARRGTSRPVRVRRV